MHAYCCFDSTPCSLGIFKKRQPLYPVTTAVPCLQRHNVLLTVTFLISSFSCIWRRIHWRTSNRPVIFKKVRQHNDSGTRKFDVPGTHSQLGAHWLSVPRTGVSTVGWTSLPPTLCTSVARSKFHSPFLSRIFLHHPLTSTWPGVLAVTVLPSHSSTFDQPNRH
jgi:hypothetical protein